MEIDARDSSYLPCYNSEYGLCALLRDKLLKDARWQRGLLKFGHSPCRKGKSPSRATPGALSQSGWTEPGVPGAYSNELAESNSGASGDQCWECHLPHTVILSLNRMSLLHTLPLDSYCWWHSSIQSCPRSSLISQCVLVNIPGVGHTEYFAMGPTNPRDLLGTSLLDWTHCFWVTWE